MARADYTYCLYDERYLHITDLNLGNMSVTNCIEDVVEEICKQEGVEPTLIYIVYRDSEGRWDGWDHGAQQFVMLDETNGINAMQKLIATA